MNKIKRTVLAMLCIAIIALPAFSVSIGKSAAVVKLTKYTTITEEQLDAKVAEYRQQAQLSGADPNTVDPLQVLDIMINDELVLQGAAKEGIYISDAIINQEYENQRLSLSQQFGQEIPKAEFDKMVVQQYGSVSAFRNSIREQIMVNQYLQLKKGDILNRMPEVSEAEINAFYRKNKGEFLNPEYVKLSHIFFEKSEENLKTAKQVVSDISSGKITFEKAVVKYSQDAASKSNAGEIGYLTIDNDQVKQIYGDAFFYGAFTTDIGDISDVIESNIGYHIIKITAHEDMKILSVNDPLSPAEPTTVHDYIKGILIQQKAYMNYVDATNSLVEDLRKQAVINITYSK